MEFNELIEKRRSVRDYDSSKKVTKEQVKQLVNAGIQAPSWKNSQTARYYCVLSDDIINMISKECLPEFNQNNSNGASLVITTFIANRSGFQPDGQATNEGGNGWGYYDLGLHNENFILKAKNIGLDTLIMGIREADKIREILNIPENEIVVSVIAVGYASKEVTKPKKKEVDEILKFY